MVFSIFAVAMAVVFILFNIFHYELRAMPTPPYSLMAAIVAHHCYCDDFWTLSVEIRDLLSVTPIILFFTVATDLTRVCMNVRV